MLRIIVCFEITNVVMFIWALATIAIKEFVYMKRSGDLNRDKRFSIYLSKHWPELGKRAFVKTIVNVFVLLGLNSALIINEYYNFLDYDAEQLKEKEKG